MKMFAVAENKELIEINKTVNVSLLKDSWIAIEKGLYKQAIAVKDIKNDDKPILFKSLPADVSKDESEDYGINFGLISGGKAESENITFYATDSLSNDIDVILALGNKGDGTLLIAGGGSSEKNQISNVVITITDNAAIAEGGVVTATCNNKRWSSTIKNGKAKLYTSEVGNYTITVVTTDAEPVTYTTMLVCPYFGQFSTDIYSGTLVVTCTEDGGNGKTCNVRSCDDEYNPTDAYNLTQTFDTGLELTFLGIPSGKYLVTVDDKYVFFKEIVTIQNVNSVNVELRQYLYKDGDECLHNTGGWIQCKVSTSFTSSNSSGVTATASGAAELGESALLCKLIGNAPLKRNGTYYMRDGFSISVAFGTKLPFKKSISLYKHLRMVKSDDNTLKGILRVGASNDENTTISTATILASGTSAGMDLALGESYPYLVFGDSCSYPAITQTTHVQSPLSIERIHSISEVWLE